MVKVGFKPKTLRYPQGLTYWCFHVVSCNNLNTDQTSQSKMRHLQQPHKQGGDSDHTNKEAAATTTQKRWKQRRDVGGRRGEEEVATGMVERRRQWRR